MIFTWSSWSSWSLAGGFMSQPSFKVAFQLTFQRLSTASRREGSEMITSTKQRKLSGLMMLHLEKTMKNYCPIILPITNLICRFPYRKQLSDGRSANRCQGTSKLFSSARLCRNISLKPRSWSPSETWWFHVLGPGFFLLGNKGDPKNGNSCCQHTIQSSW
jgi:hypothetical protein